MSIMNTLGNAGLDVAGGYGRPQTPQQPGQPRDKGLLMQYLRRKMNPVTGGMPGGVSPGMPQGAQIPMGPTPPMAAPPSNPYPGRPPVQDQQPYAQGGIIDKPTTAIIGEDGPEMVVPLSGRPDAKVSPRNVPGMSYGRR